jgi:hypothetical protein
MDFSDMGCNASVLGLVVVLIGRKHQLPRYEAVQRPL